MPKSATFEQAYARVLRFLEQRAKVVALQGQLRRLAVEGLRLSKAGKKKEALSVFRKAQILEEKLGLSRRKR